MTSDDKNKSTYIPSLKKRVNEALWKRIEQASGLGDSILKAQENNRNVGPMLTADQIRALASATGVIPEYTPSPTLKGETFFPRGNLPEETLHSIADDWRDSNIKFARTIPSAYIEKPQLEQLGITETPAYYKRNTA